MMSSETSQTTPWGVTGIVGAASELKMEAEAFAQIGNIMYVGGAFQYVQKGPNPTPDEKIAQSWLAGFDVNTGEWLSSFRPTLNGQVWDLQATPDGKLVVGGEFTSVDGDAAAVGIAEVDPITGAEVPGWNSSVGWVSTDGLPAQVRAIDYQDGWLYIGGRFNRVSGGNPLTGPVTVGRAARLRVSDGKPDGTWKPNFDGSLDRVGRQRAGRPGVLLGLLQQRQRHLLAQRRGGEHRRRRGAGARPGQVRAEHRLGHRHLPAGHQGGRQRRLGGRRRAHPRPVRPRHVQPAELEHLQVRR